MGHPLPLAYPHDPCCRWDILSLLALKIQSLIQHMVVSCRRALWSWLLFTEALSVTKYDTTLSNGYLGSRNDEERSEMRYVMRIAEFSESSNL